MQHFQLVMGYSAIKTAFAAGPMAFCVLIPGLLTYRTLPRFGLRLILTTGLVLMSAGLLWMRFLDVTASYWDLLWPMIVMSTGVGVCTAPATVAITVAVPDEKQGVASAVNDAGREVGAAIGIAITGSVLAAEYGRMIAPSLGDFPQAIRGQAAESLARAVSIAETLGPTRGRFQLAAKSAFVEAMATTASVLAVTVAIGALLVAVFAPGRNGDQAKFNLQSRKSTTGRHRVARRRQRTADQPSAARISLQRNG